MSSVITPSAEARQIYNMMVVRADADGDDLHLSLARSIELSVTLQRRGQGGSGDAVTELCEAAWIEPGSDGGWLLPLT